jgi:hypothetical protein
MSNLNTKTGNVCKKTGSYYCESHPAIEVDVENGVLFPQCSQGLGHNAIWIRILDKK